MKLKLINLTPHEIVVYRGNKVVLKIPPSGSIARVSVRKEKVGEINGIPIYRVEYGEVELPPPQENTVYIVSTLVLQALKGKRNDIISPDTSPDSVVRDKKGMIKGVKSFITL